MSLTNAKICPHCCGSVLPTAVRCRLCFKEMEPISAFPAPEGMSAFKIGIGITGTLVTLIGIAGLFTPTRVSRVHLPSPEELAISRSEGARAELDLTRSYRHQTPIDSSAPAAPRAAKPLLELPSIVLPMTARS